MRVFIAGWHGQVARALVELAPGRGEVTAFAVGRPALDLCNPASVNSALATVNPDVMINTAAYTAVDEAEQDADAAFALNCEGAGLFAELAARRNIPVIHLSTEYVFDGSKASPYVEDDRPAPQSVYGRSKLAGERAVAAANPRHVILRTSWIYSPYGTNFVKTLLRRATEEAEVDVVDDLFGCPTYAPHLAAAILTIASLVSKNREAARWGTYHAAGSGSASWFDVARTALAVSRSLGGPFAEVRATVTAPGATKVPRLANGRLDCTLLQDAFGIRLPPWQEGVTDCVRELLASTDFSRG